MSRAPDISRTFLESSAVFSKSSLTPTLNKLHFPSFNHSLTYGYKKSQISSSSSPSPSPSHSIQKTQNDQRLDMIHLFRNGKLNKYSDPLETLKEDGDWSEQQFWSSIRFLYQNSRTPEIVQVFDKWKNVEKSRSNVENYEKIICLLLRDRLTDAAILALEEMKSHGIRPSLEIYTLVIHGFARVGGFDKARFYLQEMRGAGLKPDTEIYDGLIQAYGKYKMFDEMGRCVREMELDGCSPDHLTYNLLIREFAKAGLLNKMEKTYQALIVKGMNMQTSTLIAMLEVYAKFGILDKMEKVFKRAIHSKAFIEVELVQKLASVYIENLMFSRLEELGLDFSSRTGSIDLVWCLCLLSHACSLSKKGMYSIVQEMETEEVPWNVTTANIIALALLKMKDFKQLEMLLSELPSRYVKPDIVTVGVLFDACFSGFRGDPVKRTWARAGFFDDTVELKTDGLVLLAFGKGQFLRDFEDLYLADAKTAGKGTWTYRHLIKSIKSLRDARLMGE